MAASDTPERDKYWWPLPDVEMSRREIHVGCQPLDMISCGPLTSHPCGFSADMEIE